MLQAISCLKKAIWLEPTNFNCLFNLGLVYLIAQQYASAFQTLAAAACIRLENAECYMLLGSMNIFSLINFNGFLIFAFDIAIFWCFTINSILTFGFDFSIWLKVCLRNLNDHGNAMLAFERSVLLSDALKNPLIYLNFAVHCWKMKLYELSQSNLNNFFSASENINVRHEVRLCICFSN